MVRLVRWFLATGAALALGGSWAVGGPHTVTGELAIDHAKSDRGHDLGTLRLRYKFDTFLGEPIQMYVMAWEPEDLTLDLGVVKFRAQVAQGGAPVAAWIECDPMVPAAHKGFSSDFPGSPDWDEFFLDGQGGHLSAAEAKAIFKAGFSLTNLEVISARALIGWKPGLPFDSFVGKTARRPKDGRSSLEQALEADAIRVVLTKLVGNSDAPEPEFEHTGWVFDQTIRWTQGGRGTLEKLQVEVMGKRYDAVRLTMDFLPSGLPADRVPRDYAEVKLEIHYPFLGEKRDYALRLREGETWVALLETPPPPSGSRASFVSARAERAMTDKLLEEKADIEAAALEAAPAPAEGIETSAAPPAVAEKPAPFDPFARAEETAGPEMPTVAAKSAPPAAAAARAPPPADPFAVAEQTLENQRAAAAAAREAEQIARGVTTQVYLVVEATRDLQADNPFIPEVRGLRLSTEGFQRRMREDPAFRAQVEARREREARERAERNRRAQEAQNAEWERLSAQLAARDDRRAYSEIQLIAVTERPRADFALNDDENRALRRWLDEVTPALLRKLGIKGQVYSDTVIAKPHFFVTRAEAVTFVAGKSVRPLPSSFRF